MSFRKQLIMGIGTLIAVMLFCSTVAVMSLWTTSQRAAQTTSTLYDELVANKQVRVAAGQLLAAHGYLITGDDKERATLLRAEQQLRRATGELRARTDDPALVLYLASVEQAGRQYMERLLEVTPQRGAVGSPDAVELIYEERVAPLRDGLRFVVEELTRFNRARLEGMTQRSERIVRVAGVVLVVGCAFATLIGIALAWIVSRKLFGTFTREHQAMSEARSAAAARKEVLDMVSHDLRTPLGSIVLGIEAVRAEHGELHHLGTIERAAKRMRHLVEDLLVASRAAETGLELERKRVSVRELLDLVVDLFQAHAEAADVTIRIDEAEDDEIVVDRERVLQVFSNLVGNALAFTPEGGEVTLVARRIAGNKVRFEVRDTGPGLTRASREHIFEAFNQGVKAAKRSPRRGSVGLGLYIARNLVEAHGGRIGVDSTEGDGSSFWFELPREP